MKIRIAERLRPFSHRPGTRLILPRSDHVLTLYPTLFKVNDRSIPLELSGPVKEFTVQLDLEKGCVWVWGFYREGYRRFCLWSESGEFRMAGTRGGDQAAAPLFHSKPFERLSLGSHKKQDWCLVKRRGDLKEIVPHWMRLAQLIPQVQPHQEGALGFMLQIQKNKPTLHDEIWQLYDVGFDGIFHPRLEDEDHLGISLPPVSRQCSPLALIAEGAKFLRSLFIESGSQISILPCLPSAFHCGRMVSIDLGTAGLLDMEWSKKMIKRMVFYSAVDQEQTFLFQKEIKNFRLKRGSEKGEKIISTGSALSFAKDCTYYFDRFLK